ncbi:hypothetical protein KWH04_23655 [Xanthomonas campestris pv. trichodesmae]|uniref:DUF2523 domain-containing protein n=2 Tax=Xanthomonas citri TaxID=346 RepID=A0AB33CDL1_XANCI|nr:hypothetical protein [Xanthomonas citri]ASK92184.1 hypothetical protein XcvCFBP7111P_12270 [Xanthomonas citri pv. vignicola]MBV6783548.1 hypothetical protein [Xanthomonas campestris pv. trichodesmae]MBZ3920493.1 hypothetical protein [Xanthomonas campestris pv. trichodesmae]MBZ3926867.1 hypothetical protein [Xanthomonas citri pv. sesbaniae]
MPVVLVELLAVLGPWITRFFAAKAVIMVAGFFGRLGLVLMTDKFVMEPMIEAATNAFHAIPAEFQCWFGVIGVTQMCSVVVSGLTLISAKRVFFGKKD